MRSMFFVVVLALLPTSFASAEFIVDNFSSASPGSGSAFSVSDDFGVPFTITRTATVTNGLPAPTSVVFAPGGSISYDFDFSANVDTTALGYWAENFRLEGVEFSVLQPSDITFSVVATSNTGVSSSIAPTSAITSGAPIFFDLTDLGNVGVLNDLATLSLVFSTDPDGSGATILARSLTLVANPEPTSAASLGAFCMMGMLTTLRRKRKSLA